MSRVRLLLPRLPVPAVNKPRGSDGAGLALPAHTEPSSVTGSVGVHLGLTHCQMVSPNHICDPRFVSQVQLLKVSHHVS